MKKLQTTRVFFLILTLASLLFLGAACEPEQPVFNSSYNVENSYESSYENENDNSYENSYDNSYEDDNVYESNYENNDSNENTTQYSNEEIITMKNMATQIDGVTFFPASDFNQVIDEIEGVITSDGIALSEGDLRQLAKAIASYAVSSYLCPVPATVNEYVLTQTGSRKLPSAYYVGMVARFVVPEDNTDPTTTVALGTLSGIPVSDTVLVNLETPVVVDRSLKGGLPIKLLFQQTPDGLTDYWLVMRTSLTHLGAGKAVIKNSEAGYNRTMEFRADDFSSSLVIEKVSTSDPLEKTEMSISSLLASFDDYDLAGQHINTRAQAQGIYFRGTRHPTDENPFYNKSVLDMSGSAVTFSQSATNGFWSANSSVETNIPLTCRIISASVSFEDDQGLYVVAPVSFRLDPIGGSTWATSAFVINSSRTPDTDNMKLYIEFDGTNL